MDTFRCSGAAADGDRYKKVCVFFCFTFDARGGGLYFIRRPTVTSYAPHDRRITSDTNGRYCPLVPAFNNNHPRHGFNRVILRVGNRSRSIYHNYRSTRFYADSVRLIRRTSAQKGVGTTANTRKPKNRFLVVLLKFDVNRDRVSNGFAVLRGNFYITACGIRFTNGRDQRASETRDGYIYILGEPIKRSVNRRGPFSSIVCPRRPNIRDGVTIIIFRRPLLFNGESPVAVYCYDAV